jgi:replicative DNA helicase
LNEQESRKLDAAMNHLARAPIWVDDTPSIPIMELRSKARRLAAEHNLDMVIVDYLQLVATEGGESRVQEIGQITRALKALARELRVPVVALSQLSRAVEQRTPHIPQLSDLRESGCLTGDSLVTLASGELVPIASLVGQTPEVVTLDGWRATTAPATRVWWTGIKPVFKLSLGSGRTIRATANHKFRTLTGWRALGDLKSGDRLAIARRYPESPKALHWDPSCVTLLAHLVGDGCYASRQPVHAWHPNVDTVPHEVWSLVRSRMRARGVSQRAMTSMQKTANGGTSHFSFAPSRSVLADHATVLQSDDLRAIAESDVFWDEVRSIEPGGDTDVYDMTVAGTHNFVANGIVVHNSLEQDADVVLFIYRDEKYNPDTDKKGVADIIVAKHRNGPTGQVQLLFLERTTKFLDLEVFRS